MKYVDRIPVLNSEIPVGGFGRALTSSECNKIRSHGYTCSQRWIVVRAYDSPQHGILYYPSKHSGNENRYDHAGIFVETC